MEKEGATITYAAYEAALMMSEKREKRLFIVIIALILALLVNNLAWVWYESGFETYTYEYSQDGEGLNNINTGEQGDVFYGPEAESKSP